MTTEVLSVSSEEVQAFCKRMKAAIKEKYEEFRKDVTKLVKSEKEFFLRISQKQFEEIVIPSLKDICPTDILKKIYCHLHEPEKYPEHLVKGTMMLKHFEELPAKEQEDIRKNAKKDVRFGKMIVQKTTSEILQNRRLKDQVFPRHQAKTSDACRSPEKQGTPVEVPPYYLEPVFHEIDERNPGCLITNVKQNNNSLAIVQKVRLTKNDLCDMLVMSAELFSPDEIDEIVSKLITSKKITVA